MKSIATKWWSCVISQLLLLLLVVMPTQIVHANNLFNNEVAKDTRIIGGERAQSGRFQYSVSLQDNGGHFCGGAMIARDVVLTAAHCLNDGKNIEVVIGSDNVNQGQLLKVKEQIEHPNYLDVTDQYDMALLILEEPTTLDIDLVKVNSDNLYPPVGTTTHVMGWGDTDPGSGQSLSEELLVVDLQVISNNQCEAAEQGGDKYAGWIYPSMLCTYTKGQDACQGDSGGPLIVRDDNNPEEDVIVGVVSWGGAALFYPVSFQGCHEVSLGLRRSYV